MYKYWEWLFNWTPVFEDYDKFYNEDGIIDYKLVKKYLTRWIVDKFLVKMINFVWDNFYSKEKIEKILKKFKKDKDINFELNLIRY